MGVGGYGVFQTVATFERRLFCAHRGVLGTSFLGVRSGQGPQEDPPHSAPQSGSALCSLLRAHRHQWDFIVLKGRLCVAPTDFMLCSGCSLTHSRHRQLSAPV